jgi:hypothetical protein
MPLLISPRADQILIVSWLLAGLFWLGGCATPPLLA